MYTYRGVKFTDLNNSGLVNEEDIKALTKDLKMTISWGKPSNNKCKRAEMLQYCYSVILKKGKINLEYKRVYEYSKTELQTVSNFLNKPLHEIEKYLEPLKVALSI